jgi:hypothetical protein
MKKPALIAKINVLQFLDSILTASMDELENVENFIAFLSLNASSPIGEIYDLTDEKIRELAREIVIRYRGNERSSKITVLLEEGAEAERVYAKFQSDEYRTALCFGSIGKESVSLVDLASRSYSKKPILNFKTDAYPAVRYFAATHRPHKIDDSSMSYSIYGTMRHNFLKSNFFQLCEKLNYSAEQMLIMDLFVGSDSDRQANILRRVETANAKRIPNALTWQKCVGTAIRFGIQRGADNVAALFDFVTSRFESPFVDTHDNVRYKLVNCSTNSIYYLIGYDKESKKLLLKGEKGQDYAVSIFNAACGFDVFYLDDEDASANAVAPSYLNGRLVDPRIFD